MATPEPPNPNLNCKFSRLPQDINNIIFSQLSVKDILRLRPVSKSWLSLISSPCFVKTHDMIMHNIFLRLSVKTLSRFKSVCKSWLFTISGRDFVKAHLYKSTNDPHFTYHHLFLWYDDRFTDLSIRSVYSALLHKPYTKRLVNHYIIDDMVGCCNGLVCLEKTNCLIFRNLTTRKSRRLPKFDKINYSQANNYVFCYDKLNDDYKVFCIFSNPNESKDNVSVYSSKSGCWRLIGELPFHTLSSTGKFANGAIHWERDKQKGIIVSLDVITEEYQDILLPKYGERVSRWTMDTFGENLSVLFEFINIRADFWVMKGRGVDEPWTKLFTISYNIDGLLTNHLYLKPICISVHGDILLNLDSTMVLYNSEDNTVKGLSDRFCVKIPEFSYVESLVSPHL